MNMLSSLLLALAAIAVVSPSQGAHDTKSSTLPFSITITAPAEIKVGSEIEVRVQMTNTSANEISAGTFYVDGVDTAYSYDVRDSAGNPSRRRTSDMAGSVKLGTLKPGETTEEGTLVGRVFNMTRPGQYTIQLSRAVSGSPKAQVVKSNKLTITVTP